MLNKYYLDSLALLRIGGCVLAFVSNIWYVKNPLFCKKMSLADAILPSKWRASDKLPPFAFETSGFWVCKGL